MPKAQLPGWERYRDLGIPLAIYAATRIGQLIVLGWLLPPGGSLYRQLLTWDSGWFVRVVTDGYPHGYSYDATGHLTANALAFFPLYPWLIRAVDVVGFPAGTGALIVSWTAGAIATVLLATLGRELAGHRLAARPDSAGYDSAGYDSASYDSARSDSARSDSGGVDSDSGRGGAGRWKDPVGRRTGYALAVLFCAQPMSIVESMGYSESVFVAVVAGMLLAVYRRHWPLAGLLGVAAGLTRPTGVAAAAALAVAATICLLDRARSTRERTTAVLAALAALAAVPAYIIWVGYRVGDPAAWFRIQAAGWGTTFDYGRSTARFLLETLRSGDGWVAMSVVLILIAATVAMVVAVRGVVVRDPARSPLAARSRLAAQLPLAVYGVVAFILVVGQTGFFHSKPRLLLSVVVVLLPAAFAAGRARPRAAAMWLAAYAAFGLWYGAYMITVWHYAI